MNGDQHKTCVNDQILAAEHKFREQGLPRSSRSFFTFLMDLVWRKRIYKNAYSQRSGCYLSSTFPFAFILTIRPPKSSGEKLTRIAIVCVLELSTVPVSFFRMRRMSLALSPQLWMSSLMSVSVMCWARPRTIMVLLGGTLRASSSLLKKKNREYLLTFNSTIF